MRRKWKKMTVVNDRGAADVAVRHRSAIVRRRMGAALARLTLLYLTLFPLAPSPVQAADGHLEVQNETIYQNHGGQQESDARHDASLFLEDTTNKVAEAQKKATTLRDQQAASLFQTEVGANRYLKQGPYTQNLFGADYRLQESIVLGKESSQSEGITVFHYGLIALTLVLVTGLGVSLGRRFSGWMHYQKEGNQNNG